MVRSHVTPAGRRVWEEAEWLLVTEAPSGCTGRRGGDRRRAGGVCTDCFCLPESMVCVGHWPPRQTPEKKSMTPPVPDTVTVQRHPQSEKEKHPKTRN